MLHVGLDLHKKYSTVAVMDDHGDIQSEDTLYHTTEPDSRSSSPS